MEEDKKRSVRKALTVALCFMVVFCGLGLYQPRGLFVVPITQALGIPRSVYALSDTIRNVTSAILSLFFGFFIEKFGPKKMLCTGFLLLASAALLYALAPNVWVIYAGGFLFGAGFALTGTAMVGQIVNSLCEKHSGAVLGVVLAANGAGGALFSPIYATFLKDGDPSGYRRAYYLMAAVLAAMAVVLFILFKNPAQTGAAKRRQRSFSWEGIEFSKTKKTVYFYLVCACVFITGFSLQGLTSVRSAYMSDVGIDVAFVAVVTSVSAISLASSKFLAGFFYEKAGLRATVTVGTLSALVGISLLFFLGNDATGRTLAVLYAVFIAIALPLETVMLPIYAGELFGQKSFSKTVGVFTAMYYVGSAVCSPAMNLFFDLTGSYRPAFITVAVMLTVMLVTLHIAITRAHRMRARYEQAEQLDQPEETEQTELSENA